MNTRSRNLFLAIFMIFPLWVFFPTPAHSQNQEFLKNPKDMTFPPLTFSPPKAVRTVLSNGITLYLLEDSELPLIQISALIRTGTIYDPPDKAGVADLTATMLRTGGTSGRTPQEINEDLEFRAAEIEFSMNREFASASLSVRKKDFPQVLAIFIQMLMKPAFDPDQLDLAKKQAIEAIRRSNDDPEEVAYREFRKVLYEGNPRGLVPTIESVASIQREDLIRFHRQFFLPNNVFLGISGDFKANEMIADLEKAFRDWPRSIMEFPPVPLPKRSREKSVCYVSKDLPQATILIGHLSLPLLHPDHIPLQVLNYILGGGGFNSRLTREIRSNQGLAYSVGSYYQGRVGYGVFGAFCQTKSATTHKAISLIFEIIESLQTDKKPKPEELDWAQKSLINQFIFSFTSSASVVTQQMRLEYDDLPEDHLWKYQEHVAAVTLEELERTARDHLHPDQAILLVVGKEEDFEKPLSLFGPVKQIFLKNSP